MAPYLEGTDLVPEYHIVPQSHMDGNSIPTKAGRLMGGSSGANYGGWLRAKRSDYDLWAQRAGHSRWSYQNLLPYFRRAERWHDPHTDTKQHGLDGPILTAPGNSYPLSGAFLEAFARLGVHENPDFHCGDPTGIGK